MLIDNHGVLLPETMSPGTHKLVVGLYSPNTNTRLHTMLNSDKRLDHLTLSTITVHTN
jgi:hypothetical protein